jgi:single-stranded DNA-binding protein
MPYLSNAFVTITKANLARDSRFAVTKNGKKVCNFTVGVTDGFGDKSITIWIECAMWGDHAEKASTMLLKGKEVSLVGNLRDPSDRENNGKRYVSNQIEVVSYTLHGKRGDSPAHPTVEAPATTATVDEDVPF